MSKLRCAECDQPKKLEITRFGFLCESCRQDHEETDGYGSTEPGEPVNWMVYMIQDTTGRLYLGISPDPVKRLARHNAGKGAKATRAGRPWELVWAVGPFTAAWALRHEARLKRLRKTAKLALLVGLPRVPT